MRYASVCDGIGAVHVAWQPLGWECAWTSEIEAFPAAVVEQRHGYRNLGDMTKLTEEQLDGCGPVSLLVGGTPCQSFSVAGLRKGLADARGNLALRFVQLVGVLRPTWVVWENVPGVLSSAGGRDFGTFLGALGELGYGFAYRVLDAQWYGVAQRRRRVFVVAHARDWRRAAAVLFERESLFGDPPTRGEAGQGTAVSPALRARANSSHRADTQAYAPEVSPALKARDFKGPSSDGDGDGDGASLVPVAQSFYSTESRCDNLPPPDVAPPLKVGSNGGGQPPAVAFSAKDHGGDASEELAPTMRSMGHDGSHANGGGQLAVAMPAVAHALRADGFDASEDGTGRGTPLVPVAFHSTLATNAAKQTDVHVALRSRTPGQSEASTTTVIAFNSDQSDKTRSMGEAVEQTPTLRAGGTVSVATPMAVRRLTPRECERLQGFPDDFTAITYRGKPAADGPRYKALGNSMAVPVMAWIGRRIAEVEVLP